METKEVSSLSIDRVKTIVTRALAKFYGTDNPERLTIHMMGGRLNFCCPYCGDSSETARKKRGNLYLDSLTYKCYNGGCEVFRNLNTFVRDFEMKDALTAEERNEINQLSKSSLDRKKVRNSIDFFFSKNYKDILIPRDELKSKLKLTEVKGTFAEKWLNARNHHSDEKFLWDPYRKNLYLLNLSGDETCIIGLQTRNIVKKSGSKYYTYKLSGIYEKLLGVKDSDILRRAQEIDPVSTVFGFSTVDLDNMITVFEGPMDAWLCPNAIALCSINNRFPFDVENKRYLLDSDKTGRNKASELLQQGEQIFLWTKFIKENNLPDRDKWDLNDVVDYVRERGMKINKLDNYFSSSILDLVDL